MTRICVLLLAATATAADPLPGAVEVGELEALQEQIERDIARLTPLVQQLRPYKHRYPAQQDLDGLAPERDALREQIEEINERLREARYRFQSRVKDAQIYYGALMITNMGTGKAASAQVNFRAIVENAEQRSRAKRFNTMAEDALREDAAAYEGAIQARTEDLRRRRLTRAAAAGGAALCALGALGWLLRRRLRRARTQSPAAAEPALPAPALGAAERFALEREAEEDWPFGEAFDGVDRSTGRPVLVRRLRAELQPAGAELTEFIARLERVRAMTHPCVVELHAVYLQDGLLHMAVEPLPGQPLSASLDAGSRIQLGSALRALRQIAGALDHAHGQGLLHGDLTPARVRVGLRGRVQVAEFEVARAVRRAAARRGKIVGNAAYLAPEVEVGETCPASDIYSLGVVFYEMVTGRLPFEGPNFLAQKRECRCRPPSRLAADLPAALDEPALKALEPDPARRYRSGAEFVAAVERALKALL